ncbi:DUF3830 family protein [Pseudazoarcus pumilus]|uniref:DUF3830 domain-containing protein n=1 Tax=Pseudazoarcus pumilus TaxID=2067960 RepID=A0A2I6SA23_9RHOO|nr:DUF3830 family protein [Pseudazoarcus pumilus]AUN96106.1 DUF3830 domain-containing protein [Pseudazoarcus pumilus]
MSRVRITVGERVLVAETVDAAPRTVAAFLARLPWKTQLIHVRWSGEGCWVPLGDERVDFGFENATAHPAPGDVLFYPGGYSETEIILAYGACAFASKLGPLAGNHFLSVVEGREHLREIGESCLWRGAQDVVFEHITA